MKCLRYKQIYIIYIQSKNWYNNGSKGPTLNWMRKHKNTIVEDSRFESLFSSIREEHFESEKGKK